jgi:dienelactone hydrolase
MFDTRFTRRGFLQSTSVLAGATLIGTAADLAVPAVSQAGPSGDNDSMETVLKLRLQSEDVVESQIREYLMNGVRPLPHPKSASEWTTDEKRLRKHLLETVIYYGWPKEWVNELPKFEDLGLIPSGKGYRQRKLRYEVIPGLFTTAILREPESPNGKCPATINLNGHDPGGKAAKYEQKRCINNALQGMYALSLEWFGMGEMARPENDHWMGSHLNLVGASATGLFYLAIRRGLDYLCQHPNVDAEKIGITGLSGGAWQTIIMASLDLRIAAAIPACGYFSFTSAIERNSDVGDMEYHPHDLFIDGDYSTLTAMMAPRPTMLIYGAVDEYGLRAPLQKPHLYDEIKPFFKLYGKQDNFVWHENLDPGTHNYELDNRQQSYAFFTKHFNLPVVDREVNVDSDLKSYEELAVGLPQDNLTLTSLARKMAAGIQRPAIPAGADARGKWADRSRERLKEVVRYTPVAMKHAWPLFSNRTKEVETLGYRLQFNNDLSATAIWLKPTTAADDSRLTVLLDDSGARTGGTNTISESMSRGEQVLAVNLIFTGDASPDYPKSDPVHVPEVYTKLLTAPSQMGGVIGWLKTRPPSAIYGLLLSAAGDRPLGMQAAQLIGVANWARQEHGSRTFSAKAFGIRNQVTALVAAALEPAYFSELSVSDGMKSLGYLLGDAVRYQDAPDLFCLDLYKDFDIDLLAAIAEPTKVTQKFLDEGLG